MVLMFHEVFPALDTRFIFSTYDYRFPGYEHLNSLKTKLQLKLLAIAGKLIEAIFAGFANVNLDEPKFGLHSSWVCVFVFQDAHLLIASLGQSEIPHHMRTRAKSAGSSSCTAR